MNMLVGSRSTKGEDGMRSHSKLGQAEGVLELRSRGVWAVANPRSRSEYALMDAILPPSSDRHRPPSYPFSILPLPLVSPLSLLFTVYNTFFSSTFFSLFLPLRFSFAFLSPSPSLFPLFALTLFRHFSSFRFYR